MGVVDVDSFSGTKVGLRAFVGDHGNKVNTGR